jgi:hypothetical protein
MDGLSRIVATGGTMPKRWRNVGTALVALSVLMAFLLGVIPAWYAPSNGVIFAAFAPGIVGLSLWFIDFATRDDDASSEDASVVSWRDHIEELVIAPCLLATLVAILAVLTIAIFTHFIFYGLL